MHTETATIAISSIEVNGYYGFSLNLLQLLSGKLFEAPETTVLQFLRRVLVTKGQVRPLVQLVEVQPNRSGLPKQQSLSDMMPFIEQAAAKQPGVTILYNGSLRTAERDIQTIVSHTGARN